MKKGKQHFDIYFLITVLVLLGFGLIMIMSASSEWSRSQSYTGYDALFYAKRQAMWAGISILAMLFFARFDYHRLGKLSNLILGVAVVLLVLVLAVGTESKGGKRWLNLGFIQFQPSEAAKIALIIFLSWNLSKKDDPLKKFATGLLPYLLVIGFVCGLIILEKHFSATMLVLLVSLGILFVAGARIPHLMALGLPVVMGAFVLVRTSAYRWKRVTSFLDPFADKLGDGYQIIQSLYAIGSGGIFGLGLGRSRQKFSYIPEPHNDFIFAILCEELGLVGAMLVIMLFTVLIWRGVRIALAAPDKFGSYLAMGIMMLIAFQVVLNIAVVTSSMPVTGVALPFFSYGGTSLVMIMSCMGIMLNISSKGKE